MWFYFLSFDILLQSTTQWSIQYAPFLEVPPSVDFTFLDIGKKGLTEECVCLACLSSFNLGMFSFAQCTPGSKRAKHQFCTWLAAMLCFEPTNRKRVQGLSLVLNSEHLRTPYFHQLGLTLSCKDVLMDVGQRYKLADPNAMEVGPNGNPLVFLCYSFVSTAVLMQEWALEEGNLHRALSSKILAAYSRTPAARPMISDHCMFP